jgi:hypothetical protein
VDTIIILLLLLGINPPAFDNPTVTTGGYIEINHFWAEYDNPTRKIGDKEVKYGKVVFDQIIIWEYNKEKGKYEVLHWKMVHGREIDYMSWTEKETERTKLLEEWEKIHRTVAKASDLPLEDVVIYHDSKWVGLKGEFNNPKFNNKTNRYEIYCKSRNEGNANDGYDPKEKYTKDLTVYKFTALSLIETNTVFDPAAENAQMRGLNSTSTRFAGYKEIFDKMIFLKRNKIDILR